MIQYVALLRGINVGGKNVIRMADLRTCFEQQGLDDVVTYIQSGNVLFKTTDSDVTKITRRIEEALGATFGYRASVVLRSQKELRHIVTRVPPGFGASPDRYRYDVIFLKAPLAASAAIASVATKKGVDQAHAGVGVLYLSRLISKATQSMLSKIVLLPIYQSMTIRNWNTTTKLLSLMEGE